MIFREKKLQFYLEIVTCDPLNFTMDHSKFIASIQKEEFISAFKGSADNYIQQLVFCFIALRPKSTAMVMAGRSVHLTTLFPGQA